MILFFFYSLVKDRMPPVVEGVVVRSDITWEKPVLAVWETSIARLEACFGIVAMATTASVSARHLQANDILQIPSSGDTAQRRGQVLQEWMSSPALVKW